MKTVTKILIVRNNPQNQKKSKLAKLETFLTTQIEAHKNCQIKIHDLYSENFLPRLDAAFLAFVLNPQPAPSEDNKQKIAQKALIANDFLWAELIIFVTPYWTGLFPSALKDWIDLLPYEKMVDPTPEGRPGKAQIPLKEVLMLQTSGQLTSAHLMPNYGLEMLRSVMARYGLQPENFTYMMGEGAYATQWNVTKVETQITSYLNRVLAKQTKSN